MFIEQKILRYSNNEQKYQLEIEQLHKDLRDMETRYKSQLTAQENQIIQQCQQELDEAVLEKNVEIANQNKKIMELQTEIATLNQYLEESQEEARGLQIQLHQVTVFSQHIQIITEDLLPGFSSVRSPEFKLPADQVQNQLNQLQKIVKAFKQTFKESKSEFAREIAELKSSAQLKLTEFYQLQAENTSLKASLNEMTTNYKNVYAQAQKLKQISEEQLQILETTQTQCKNQRDQIKKQEQNINHQNKIVLELEQQINEQAELRRKYEDKIYKTTEENTKLYKRVEQMQQSILKLGIYPQDEKVDQQFINELMQSGTQAEEETVRNKIK
ncbi:Conserved_hypothetical protein [Hexamita inflata]|uniref:Uncharacterized protein n=1 Tax=Hexamita inflata TaxID=28002 RepID=A0AA86TQE7_9EUKA|nr:Conserved hypothetical protein [Hexamita inflata]CAI9971819.1 Conserved hypothetical protein [Hexamita inflata]